MPKARATLASTQPDREITMGDLFDAIGSLVMRVNKLSERTEALYAATERCATQVAKLTEALRADKESRRKGD